MLIPSCLRIRDDCTVSQTYLKNNLYVSNWYIYDHINFFLTESGCVVNILILSSKQQLSISIAFDQDKD